MKWKRLMHFSIVSIGLILGIAVYAFINVDAENLPKEYIASGVLGIGIAYSSTYLSIFLDHQLKWKNSTGIRLLAGIMLQTIFIIGIVVGGMKALHGIVSLALIAKFSILILSISLMYNIVYFIFYSYHSYTEGQVQEKAFERLQKELQLSALKSQLSPHFLFNSLNVLSALFYKNIEDAETFIRNLAKSFSYVLENYNSPLVTLQKELEFTTNYVALMNLRFGSFLQIEMALDKEILESKVPPLTIQMLIENAVKHNMRNEQNELIVRLNYVNGFVVISNYKNARVAERNSTKVGLANISRRYELLLGMPILIEDSSYFKVKLPIIR